MVSNRFSFPQLKWSIAPSLTTVFLMIFGIASTAQQPGGVFGTKVWYVSQKSTIPYLEDISGHGFKPAVPDFAGDSRMINFHFAAFFTSMSTPDLDVSFEGFDFKRGTVIGLFFPKDMNDFDIAPYYVGLKDNNQLGFELSYNNVEAIEGAKRTTLPFGDPKNRTTLEIDDKFTTVNNALKSGQYYVGWGNQNHNIWGEEKSARLTGRFGGYLPELLVYTRVLAREEIIKLKTYLSIKYGTTLDTSYIVRDGTTIWNINDPLIRPFHNQVTAIAKDYAAGLSQRRSNTSYEEGYKSYTYDGAFKKSHLDPPNDITIPRLDSPSLYRTLTIGFTNYDAVQEGTYIMWGDNNAAIPAKPFTDIDPTSRIQTTSRVWLLKNPSKIQVPLRMALAGNSYETTPQTLFEKGYDPFDYQFYRYLLIPLKSPNVKDTAAFILNTYFGREQSSAEKAENFETRFLVWDSVLFHGYSDISYFTFGRVPLLSFWEVIKKRGKKAELHELLYTYDRNQPLRPHTQFDSTIYEYQETDSIQLKLSLGIAPVTVRYREDRPGAVWADIKDTVSIAELYQDSTITAPIMPSVAPADTPASGEQSEEIAVGMKRYLKRQRWKKELPYEYIKLPKLKTNTTYLVEASDRLGQKSLLTLRLNANPKPKPKK